MKREYIVNKGNHNINVFYPQMVQFGALTQDAGMSNALEGGVFGRKL